MSNSNQDSTATSSSEHSSPLRYRRIRAPKNHGETLHLPPVENWNNLWQSNCSLKREASELNDGSLDSLRKLARSEVLQKAFEFTESHRDVDLVDRAQDRIVMGGHQPSLFHPGVWYKNFVLARLGEQFNCVPINLIVDNDTCNSTHVNVPARDHSNGQLLTKRVSYDSNRKIVPFENRTIVDKEQFDGFAKSLSNELKGFVSEPIVNLFWPYVMANTKTENLGLTLSKGRHRLEQDLGLQTLEIPVSKISATRAFALFVKELLVRNNELHGIYNSTIQDYRRIHKIKSVAQPIPELSKQDEWIESPLWIWTPESANRRNLFSKIDNSHLHVSDLNSINTSVPLNCDSGEFREFLTTDICVRPKAITTTMFCRLVLSDVFVHGIGGSKYDQLTDEITRQFFHTTLPDYITTTATYFIQSDINPIHPNQLSNVRNEIRELRYHPERFIENPADDAKRWIDRKSEWIAKELPDGERLQRHKSIIEANQALRPYVVDKSSRLEQHLADLFEQKISTDILANREFSFCIHGTDLLQQLKDVRFN